MGGYLDNMLFSNLKFHEWGLTFMIINIYIGRGHGNVLLDLTEDEIIDLSYPFNNRTVYYPDAEQLGFTFKLGTVYHGVNKQGIYGAAFWFQAAEHGGTHVDAPSHTQTNGSTVDKIPLNQLIGLSAVIDVSHKSLRNPNFLVSVEDIQTWEEQYGKIPRNCVLFVYFGWARKWPHKNALFGTKNFPEDATYRFPGIHPETAQWLLKHRKLKAIGTDGPSVDSGQNQRLHPVQHLLAASRVVTIEFVANLDRLPSVGAMVIGLPMKIEGGSGAPVRLIAFNWNRGEGTSRRNKKPPGDRQRKTTPGSITPAASPVTSLPSGSGRSGLNDSTTGASVSFQGRKDASKVPKINCGVNKDKHKCMSLSPFLLAVYYAWYFGWRINVLA